MMTIEELQHAKINPEVAKEAHSQARHRLSDVLAIKDTYEQKAFALFAGYLTVALALFGAGQELHHLAFWVAGTFYVVGSGCFAFALLDQNYGVHGSTPEMWLRPGVIDGDDQVVPMMLAYLTNYHQARIVTSQEGNGRKSLLLRIGIGLGLLGPLAMAAMVLFAS